VVNTTGCRLSLREISLIAVNFAVWRYDSLILLYLIIPLTGILATLAPKFAAPLKPALHVPGVIEFLGFNRSLGPGIYPQQTRGSNGLAYRYFHLISDLHLGIRWKFD
jgi:hypothetical protein